MEFVTTGRVEKGKLTVRNRQQMLDHLSKWKDCEVIVRVEKAHATRSEAQNAFYWSVVVPRIALHYKKKPDEMHEILKAVHLPHDLARQGKNGTLMNGYVIGGSTAKLNVLEFIDYLDTIIMWAAERGVVIPDANPEWRQAAEAQLSKGRTDAA